MTNHDADEQKPRKIVASDYDYLCWPTAVERGGDPDCDHDFPPETTCSNDDTVEWFSCSICGLRLGFEVYD